MTYDSRVRPHQIRPADSNGDSVAAGTYMFQVSNSDAPEVGGTAVDGFAASAAVVLLPAGSDASDVPTGTPVGAIILMKG